MKQLQVEVFARVFWRLLLIVFLLSNCSNNCQVDLNVENSFKKHYSKALGVFQGNEVSLNIEQAISIQYLSKVSGINDNLEYSEMVFIKDNDEFRKLMKDWKNWYDYHNCEISVSYSDSLDNQAEEYLKLNYPAAREEED